MARAGSRGKGTIPAVPAAKPKPSASSRTSAVGPAHPRSRKPGTPTQGQGNSGGNSNK